MPLLYGYANLQYGATLLDSAEQNPVHLSKSIDALERSVAVLPNEPTSLRYLARAYWKCNRLEDAISALEHALELSPRSLLIQKELFLAYQYARYNNKLLDYEKEITIEQAIGAGDSSFIEEDFRQALIWYQWVNNQWPDFRSKIDFRLLLTIVSLQDNSRMIETIHQIQESSLESSIVKFKDNTTVVPGSELRWVGFIGVPNFEFGTKLGHQTEGTFWWSGRGSLLVEINKPSQYLVQVVVRNSNPPPVEMAFGMNGKPIREVSLTKGDNSWSTVEFTITLTSPSLISIDVWFLNNGRVGNLDRDAVVRQIEIKRLD